jgi:hypothetical protein
MKTPVFWDIALLNKLKMGTPVTPEMYLAPYSGIRVVLNILRSIKDGKSKGKVHPCTGTEALYRPYGP